MNINDILGAAAQNPKIVNAIAKQFGLNEAQAGQAVSGLLKQVGGGVQRNVQQGGLAGLEAALEKGNHQKFFEQPEQLPQATGEGNKILGHLLGGKDQSRAAAAQVAQETGIGDDILKKMLPMVAAAAMGSLSKSRASSGQGGLGSVLGMLDQDGDGNPLNDIMSMLGGKNAA